MFTCGRPTGNGFKWFMWNCILKASKALCCLPGYTLLFIFFISSTEMASAGLAWFTVWTHKNHNKFFFTKGYRLWQCYSKGFGSCQTLDHGLGQNKHLINIVMVKIIITWFGRWLVVVKRNITDWGRQTFVKVQCFVNQSIHLKLLLLAAFVAVR